MSSATIAPSNTAVPGDVGNDVGRVLTQGEQTIVGPEQPVTEKPGDANAVQEDDTVVDEDDEDPVGESEAANDEAASDSGTKLAAQPATANEQAGAASCDVDTAAADPS